MLKLILFGADTCVPCSAAKTALEGVEYEYFDICRRPDLAMRYSLRSIPTLIAIDDEGNAIKQLVGRITRDAALLLVAQGDKT